MKDFKDLKPFFHLLIKYRLSVAVIVIASGLVSFLEGLSLGMLVPILEGIKGTGASIMPFPFDILASLFKGIPILTRVRVIAVLMVGLIILKSVVSYINGMVGMHLQVDIVRRYRLLSFSQLMKLGMGFINRQKAGEMQSFIISFPAFVGAMVYHFTIFLPRLFTISVYLAMLIILSWQMTLAALLLMITASLLVTSLVAYTNKIGTLTTRSYLHLNSMFLESFAGIKIAHLFNREKDVAGSFERAALDVQNNEYALNRAKFIFNPSLEIIGIAGLAAIMVLGSLVMGKYGPATIEMLLFFIYILMRVLPQMVELNHLRINLASNMPFISKVFAFIDPSDKEYIINGVARFDGLRHSIVFNKLSFAYLKNEPPVISEMSVVIPRGKKIGIVGPSGSGKSTITELLLRFYDPQEGAILVDGVDIKELDLHTWRKRLGVVTQDTFLFNDTVKANIAYSKPSATQKEIEQAAQRAYAHDFISEMPQGYNSVLGERGVFLSGGQRQRIAVARAILAEPEILIFDEATSALDTDSERMVQRALDEIGKGRTVITIAHRLSTVTDADLIIVIEGGRIVQQGSHQDLVRNEGLYKRLVKMQTLTASAA